MEAKLQQLVEQVDKACETIDKLAEENHRLRAEVTELKQKLTRVTKEYDSIRLGQTDKSDSIKAKLTGIIERLNQLEDLAPQVFS